MLNLEGIKKMIAKGENSTMECKLTTGELHRGMESACAFMNSDGGWLLFGISPQMQIVGQDVSDSTRREIAAELRKIEPPVEVETEYIELPDRKGKFVIALHCNSTNFRNGPYSYDGRAFYRIESTTIRSSARKAHGVVSLSTGRFPTHDAPELTGDQSKLRQSTGKSHGATSPSTGAFSTYDASEVIHDKTLIKDKRIKAKILRYCAQPRTLREIAGMLGLTNLRWVRRRYLVPLLQEGLQHTIPQRPTSHYQKYVASIPSRGKDK